MVDYNYISEEKYYLIKRDDNRYYTDEGRWSSNLIDARFLQYDDTEYYNRLFAWRYPSACKVVTLKITTYRDEKKGCIVYKFDEVDE